MTLHVPNVDIPLADVPATAGPATSTTPTPRPNEGEPIAFPNSRKVYVPGVMHADVRVAMREIAVETPKSQHVKTPTPETDSGVKAVTVYDTSGSYTDEDAVIDVRKGLAPLRLGWIAGRGDVEPYAGRTTGIAARRPSWRSSASPTRPGAGRCGRRAGRTSARCTTPAAA
jgi:hypothetical protein